MTARALVDRAGSVLGLVLVAAIFGIAALGMTMVIVGGGIDLSVGSVIALSTVVVAVLLNRTPLPWLAALGGIGAAMLCGAMNGLLITQLRVVPFIVTLGTMLVVRGAAKGLAEERRIEAPATWLNDLLRSRTEGVLGLLPSGIWLLAALALVVGGVFGYTRFGRRLFAIGSNERMARLCGVAVERCKVAMYTIAGGFAGLAGVLQFSKLSVGDPTVAVGLELDVIAAVIIGGGSLLGGRGTVLGTLVGATIMTLIQIGCSQKGLPNWVQQIITGGIIVVAVALDRTRTGRVSHGL